MGKIFLSEPSIKGHEWKYVKECLDSTWISSAGKYVELFERKIAEYTGTKYAVACVNGTSALQVSLRLAGVLPGEEVIVPTLTFIAPVNAVSYNGATPVFMDADKYYNIDAGKTISFINNETVFNNGITLNKKTNKRIAAIVPVHVWGNAAYLDELVPLCEERNIAVVEDASESMGTVYNIGKYKGYHTGIIGRLGCLSFNGNKIITTGGGGMILTDDEILADKARYLTTQAKDDQVRYIHNEIGYNFRLSNIHAALGVAQLEQLPGFLERKQEIFYKYQTAFVNVDGIHIADMPEYADNNHWLNIMQIDENIFGLNRDFLMELLGKNNIHTRPVWFLNHLQRPFKKCQSYQIDMANHLLNISLCLPSGSNVTNSEIKKIIRIIINESL